MIPLERKSVRVPRDYPLERKSVRVSRNDPSRVEERKGSKR
jgi:hypothetical protein